MNFKTKKSKYNKGAGNAEAQGVSQLNKRNIIKNIISVYFKRESIHKGITKLHGIFFLFAAKLSIISLLWISSLIYMASL
jgi:hypothetical protein